jgi:hypothetical protein
MQSPILEKHPDMDEYKICHQLGTEHLDFLEQIRLEVQLHYEFKLKPEAEPHHDSKNKGLPAFVIFDYKDLEAFMENDEKLTKMHGKAVKKANKLLKIPLIPKERKKVMREKIASYVCLFF